jgi:hypothetical protein
MSQEIPTRRVFLSYRNLEPDVSLAQAFRREITGAGHYCFMSGESLLPGDDWQERIDAELEQCDLFLLLLSSESAASKMVREEVRRAERLNDARPDKRPRILPVYIRLSPETPVNYALASYINPFQRTEWKSEADTERVCGVILQVIGSGNPSLGMAGQPAPQQVLRNKGLSPQLYHSLRKMLIEDCEEFANHSQLLSLFRIGNLNIWRKYLPPPGNLDETVDKVIGELATRHNTSGENALASLLLVLAERRDPDDDLRNRLLTFSHHCQQVLSDS